VNEYVDVNALDHLTDIYQSVLEKLLT
jgi:acetylornithine deacetylase/succinyl-diaminopimelate desuccinylase-like protein